MEKHIPVFLSFTLGFGLGVLVYDAAVKWPPPALRKEAPSSPAKPAVYLKPSTKV